MTPEEQERILACTQEIADILYRNAPKESLKSLEGIEQTVRQQMLEHVSPDIALFLSTMKPERAKGRVRTVKSLVGELRLRV